MSVLSNFENRVEGAVDGAAAALFSSPIEPAQIAKKAEKQMKREKLVGSGRQYAPTLYNVLVNERDDKRLFGFYPTLASEIENYLYAKGTEAGMEFDSRPLVRFIPDPGLKKGRFDVIAEVVAAPIIRKLREEEMEYYGLAPQKGSAQPGDAAQRNEDAVPSRRTRNPQEGDSRLAGLDVPATSVSDVDPFVASPLSPGQEAYGAIPLPDEPKVGMIASFPSSDKSAHNAPGVSKSTLSATDLKEDSSPALGHAYLFNHAEQTSHTLKKRKLTVGRGKDNDITVADVNASRVHIRFSQDATGKWKLTDLGSTNGTLLNGRPVSSAILKNGDEITLGTTILEFSE